MQKQIEPVPNSPSHLPATLAESAVEGDEKLPVFPELLIAESGSPVAQRRKNYGQRKTHGFRAQLLAYAEADGLWDAGSAGNKVTRPVWMVLGCSEHEAAPFVANLQMGRAADVVPEHSWSSKTPERFEIQRSARFVYRKEVLPAGVVVKVFHPELFRRDPGMVDTQEASFLLLPDRAWCEAQSLDVTGALAHVRRAGFLWPVAALRELLPIAPLFLAYLNRRTRCPLIPDAAFALQVLVGALANGMASRAGTENRHAEEVPWTRGAFGYREHRVTWVNALPGVAFKAKQTDLEPFLADMIDRYLALAPAVKKPEAKRAISKAQRAGQDVTLG